MMLAVGVVVGLVVTAHAGYPSRKFSNGVLDPPEDACQFEKRPIKRNGVNFRYIKSAAANPREKAKLDLRIRIYEREAYVHQNGKLLISCVAPETHRFVVMSEYESMIHRIETEFVSATPYRVSIEQTLYPFPYYEEFNDYGFRDGDIIHFNGFFRRSFQVMFVTNDNFHTSRYLDFLIDKDDQLLGEHTQHRSLYGFLAKTTDDNLLQAGVLETDLSVTYRDPTDTNQPQHITASPDLKFRDIDWRDVFIERKDHELLVSVSFLMNNICAVYASPFCGLMIRFFRSFLYSLSSPPIFQLSH
uniref:Uncharacterized protein n=1 Tax=Ascaris lumbricoides TaxID=6252 RepID=A0A9J2PX17_ASCLU